MFWTIGSYLLIKRQASKISRQVHIPRQQYLICWKCCHKERVWTAIDRLSIRWKNDLSDKIKWDFFQALIVSILLYGCTTWTLAKRTEKKLDEKVYKNATSFFGQVPEAASQKTAAVWPLIFHLTNHPSKTN